MPRNTDLLLSRYQMSLIHSVVSHLISIGQVPVWLMIECEMEGLDAEAIIDEITDQIENLNYVQ